MATEQTINAKVTEETIIVRVENLSTAPDPTANANPIFETVQFNTNLSEIPAYSKGLQFWHPDQNTMASYGQFEGPILNYGEELWAVGVNKTGSTILDGKVTYVSGALGNRPTYGLARADSLATSLVIGAATMNIADNAEGISDTFGLLRDTDTTGTGVGETWVDGQVLYVHPTIAGEKTNVMPPAPNLIIPIALVLNAHATQGLLFVRAHFPTNLAAGTANGQIQFRNGMVLDADSDFVYNKDTKTLAVPNLILSSQTIHHDTSHILTGMSTDQQDLFVTTAGSDIYFETEKVGGGDIEYIFDEISKVLDCTTGDGAGGKAQVQLTAGTATVPVRNYVYITLSGGVATLTASTTRPTGQFAFVAYITVLDATTTIAEGPVQVQRTNESLKHDGRGALVYMREKLRALGGTYDSGIGQVLTITTNGGSEDNVVLTTAAGKVFQLHLQDFPALDISTDGIFVANASGAGVLTKYQKLTDLNEAFETSDGTAITTNSYFNLVIWGSMNSDVNGTPQCKLFVNLPNDVYSQESEAVTDASNYSVSSVPEEFSSTAFLIAHVRLKYILASGGTWTNLLGGTATTSLLGISLGFNLGGSGGSSSATSLDTTNFNNILSDTDDTVQKAMDTLDDHEHLSHVPLLSYDLNVGDYVSGTVEDTFDTDEASCIIIDEVSGGFDVDLNYLTIPGKKFHDVHLLFKYTGNVGHNIRTFTQAYNYDTLTFDEIGTEPDHSTSFVDVHYNVTDDHTDSNGNMQIKVLHESPGTPGHQLCIAHTDGHVANDGDANSIRGMNVEVATLADGRVMYFDLATGLIKWKTAVTPQVIGDVIASAESKTVLFGTDGFAISNSEDNDTLVEYTYNDLKAQLGTVFVTLANFIAAFPNKSTLDKITESGGLPLWDGGAWPGGGGASFTWNRGQIGASYADYIGYLPVPDELVGKDIKEVRISSLALPVGQDIEIQVYKKSSGDDTSPTTTDSVFTADIPIDIDTSESLTTGMYQAGCDESGSTVGTAGTTLDAARVTLAADDVLYIYITQVGSTVTGADIEVEVIIG